MHLFGDLNGNKCRTMFFCTYCSNIIDIIRELREHPANKHSQLFVPCRINLASCILYPSTKTTKSFMLQTRTDFLRTFVIFSLLISILFYFLYICKTMLGLFAEKNKPIKAFTLQKKSFCFSEVASKKLL